jgi:hypothetical protein
MGETRGFGAGGKHVVIVVAGLACAVLVVLTMQSETSQSTRPHTSETPYERTLRLHRAALAELTEKRKEARTAGEAEHADAMIEMLTFLTFMQLVQQAEADFARAADEGEQGPFVLEDRDRGGDVDIEPLIQATPGAEGRRAALRQMLSRNPGVHRWMLRNWQVAFLGAADWHARQRAGGAEGTAANAEESEAVDRKE